MINHLPADADAKTSRRGLQLCLLANLNCFAFDFVARQKIGGVNLNFFIVEQLPDRSRPTATPSVARGTSGRRWKNGFPTGC